MFRPHASLSPLFSSRRSLFCSDWLCLCCQVPSPIPLVHFSEMSEPPPTPRYHLGPPHSCLCSFRGPPKPGGPAQERSASSFGGLPFRRLSLYRARAAVVQLQHQGSPASWGCMWYRAGLWSLQPHHQIAASEASQASNRKCWGRTWYKRWWSRTNWRILRRSACFHYPPVPSCSDSPRRLSPCTFPWRRP